MSRILFCVIPERGHINPYIGPAEHLVASGAEVAFWAAHDISEQLARAGLAFVGARVARPPSDLRSGASFAEQVRDPEWLRGWIKSMLVDSVEAQIEPLRHAIRSFRPDVVALDPMLYAAAIACEHERVAWASISNSLNPALPDTLDSELLRTVRWLAPDRDALFARHGLRARFRGCDLLSPQLTIAFATERFVGRVDGVHLVGPSLPRGVRGDEEPLPWERLSGAPLAYMSLGSQIYYQPSLFRRVIDAVAERPVQLVISVAELFGAPELGSLPSNVLAVRYAPQLAVLARARAFITHGGANSVMEALAAGVPLLLIPQCNDQFHQAHFVAATGVGRTLDDNQDVWRVLDGLLRPGPIRARVSEVSASYQIDGSAETARLLTALAAENRRAPAS